MNYRSITWMALLFFAFTVSAQDAPAVKVTSTKAGKDVYMITGKGGNIGVIVTPAEVVVIDAQYPDMYPLIDSTIATITDLPVRRLINTHWHGDHTGGNDQFAAGGAEIIAHGNVRARMEKGQYLAFFDRQVPPASNTSLPVVTFNGDANLYIGGEQIELIHIPGAHTDGDVMVWLPEKNVLHMGDLYFNGMYPFIDGSSGGNIKGIIAGCERALKMTDYSTIIIPGHGPISNRSELAKYLGMLKDAYNFVKMARDDGAGMSSVVNTAESFMQQYEADYGKGFISARDLIAFIYNSF